MNKEELESIVAKSNQSFFDKIMAKLFPFKAIMVTDANGATIDFPEVPEGGEIKVGDKVSAPDGEVVMATGETYVIAGGILTEIKPAEAEKPEVSVELEAIKAENAALKTELESVKAKATELDTIKAQLATFKSQMVVTDPAEKTEKVTEKTTGKFSYNGKK